MSKIKVRNESRPTRCEICHQVDQFDADRNFCARCNVVPVGEAIKLQDTEELRTELAQLSASINQVADDLERADPPAPMVSTDDPYYSRRNGDWVVPVAAPEPEPEFEFNPEKLRDELKMFANYVLEPQQLKKAQEVEEVTRKLLVVFGLLTIFTLLLLFVGLLASAQGI